MKNTLGLDFRSFAPTSTERRTATQRADLALHDSHFASLLAEAHAHQRLYDLDPHLSRVLDRIACGWHTDDLAGLICSNDSGIVAFDDSWTLFAWSLWWTQHHATDPSLEVVILHADDHRDLVSPLLAKVQRWLESGNEGWIDVLTGRRVSLTDAESVASAVLSGAIGIGTFMVPLIHSLRRVEIRHLQLGVKENAKFCMRRSTMVDPRLLPIAKRLSIEERPLESLNGNPAAIYASTSEVSEWVRDIPIQAKVLLHIDLDYFNDLYAGGRAPNRPEPGKGEMKADIESLCEALAVSGVCRRIENTAIALSPGFCPSQCWEFLLVHLRQCLQMIGCPCP